MAEQGKSPAKAPSTKSGTRPRKHAAEGGPGATAQTAPTRRPSRGADPEHRPGLAGGGAGALPPGARIEMRKLADLVPFPEQDRYYGDASDHEVSRLAQNIQRIGLQQRLHVLPENQAGYAKDTILQGHQRARALALLKKAEIDVIVRYDLAEATADQIEEVFHQDNAERRQMDPLAQTRVALRRWEIARGRRASRRSLAYGSLRDIIGQTIGQSGRSLQRYVNILQTPVEIQDAFRTKRLSLLVAEQVAFLDRAVQERIAGRIRAGEAARAVVAEYVAAQAVSRDPDKALARLVRSLERDLRDLARLVDLQPNTKAQKALRSAGKSLDGVVADLKALLPKPRITIAQVSRMMREKRAAGQQEGGLP